ncbi:hypothetical protein AK36_4768 [Burkholderia vietnamiensis LMG 10929]|nr:hypothetical protein AK36_4768 [Burkholderia vietnamiensis LMG 10929]
MSFVPFPSRFVRFRHPANANANANPRACGGAA